MKFAAPVKGLDHLSSFFTVQPFPIINEYFDPMTRQQQIQAIREKCIEANPEIDICEWSGLPYQHCACKDISRHNRPIRLADILLAINQLQGDGSYVISDAGIFAFFKAEGARIDKALKVLECSYNLRADSLESQSDETVDFLHSLLNAEMKA